MAAISRSFFRATILIFAIITLCAVDFLFSHQRERFGMRNEGVRFQIPIENPGFNPPMSNRKDVTERLDLSEDQCRLSFPGLTKDVDDNVKRGRFVFRKSIADYRGLVQGRIKNNRLHILTSAPDVTPEVLHQRTAILSQIHRALITSPSPLPDTQFAFVINDSPKNNSWAFAKPNRADSDYNTWLMPHFGFWSWAGKGKAMGLGAMDDTLSKIERVERVQAWEKKIDKVVWRGTPWFNPVGHGTLRQDLIKAAKDREWADVAALNVTAQGQYSNALAIEEFCRYRFVVYTEGVTYSGRLPYHQACRSVLLTPPLTYLTHTAMLMKPVDAEDLMKAFGDREEKGKRPAFNGPPSSSNSQKGSTVQPLLAKVSDWRTANAIYLSSDFSNLQRAILFLRSHPDVAQTIARNQRDVVVGKGYLSSAAESCYWRALLKGWASVTMVKDRDAGEDEKWGDELGERYENWILRQVVEKREGVGTRGRTGGG